MKKYSLNPKNTLAILIGISKYADFDDIEPAPNNVEAFAKILKDEDIFGIPHSNIKTIIEGSSTGIKNSLFEYTENAKKQGIKTLVLYFAGHGYRRTDGSYFLAASDTKKRLINLDGSTALPYHAVKKIIKSSGIPQSIVLLDACYSGMAVQGDETAVKELELKGAYTITSSDSKEVSYFDTDETYTLFTGELLNILKGGLPIEEEKVSLNIFYEALRNAVKEKNPKMSPQQLASKEITGDNFYFFKNKKFDKEAKLVEELEASIKEGEEFIETGNYRKAKRYFNGLLTEVKEDLKNEIHKSRLIKKIETSIDICINIPQYKPIVERILKKQYEQKIESAQKTILAREEELKNLKQKVSDTESKHKAQIELLKDEIETKMKEIASLKAGLKKQETKIKNLEDAVRQGEDIYKKAKTEISKLEKAIGDLKNKTRPLPGQSEKDFTEKVNNLRFEMVFVKGGAFQMGSEEYDDEKPIHQVTLSDYHIGKYPVTQELWKAVMGSNPSSFKGIKLPVEKISWDDVQEFIKKLNKMTGKDYRLPTEAEWEYAARGGNKSRGFKYAGSNNLKEVGWFNEDSNTKTNPVGEKNPNELGLYDMSGNVWEWCWDWYGENYYQNSPDENPSGPKKGKRRVLRGGSWDVNDSSCRVSIRGSYDPDNRSDDSGFRLSQG